MYMCIFVSMKIEKAKNTMALLRITLELRQKQMADLLGVTIGTIQSIETNRLTLSKKLAERAGFETGVNPQWLLANDISKPIDTDGIDPAQSFEIRQHVQKQKQLGPNVLRFRAFWESITRLVAIASIAARRLKFGLFLYKLRRMISDLEQEFSCDESLDTRLRKAIQCEVQRVKPTVLKIQPLSEAVSAIFFGKEKSK
jgi:DNA-binding XRE family transcriptional regulator